MLRFLTDCRLMLSTSRNIISCSSGIRAGPDQVSGTSARRSSVDTGARGFDAARLQAVAEAPNLRLRAWPVSMTAGPLIHKDDRLVHREAYRRFVNRPALIPSLNHRVVVARQQLNRGVELRLVTGKSAGRTRPGIVVSPF
jgi:hypothetical protein